MILVCSELGNILQDPSWIALTVKYRVISPSQLIKHLKIIKKKPA